MLDVLDLYDWVPLFHNKTKEC